MNLADLRKPFPPDRISWRVGSTTKDKSKGMALAYIDARDVQDRLDEVCGVEGWQCRYVPMHDKKTVCEIGIFVERAQAPTRPGAVWEWIWKADGAGDSDVEAEKGALSDAFKRAAVKWGVGRYLYDLDSPWVELDTYEKGGQVYAKGIKPHEMKRLESILASKAPANPQRSAIHTPKSMLQDDDVAEGIKNWVDQQKHFLNNCLSVADVTAWEELRHDAMEKLRKKSTAHWSDMVKYKEARIAAINKGTH